jgi:hypothetical protein
MKTVASPQLCLYLFTEICFTCGCSSLLVKVMITAPFCMRGTCAAMAAMVASEKHVELAKMTSPSAAQSTGQAVGWGICPRGGEGSATKEPR